MFCDKCGKPAGDGEKFCRYCGSPLIRKAGPAEVRKPAAGGPGQTVSGRSPGKNRKKYILAAAAAAAVVVLVIFLLLRSTPPARMERAAGKGDYETVLKIAGEEQEKGLSAKMLTELTDVLTQIYGEYDSGQREHAETEELLRRFSEIQDLSGQVGGMMCLVSGDENMKQSAYEPAVEEYRLALEYNPELEPAKEGLEEASGQYREQVIQTAEELVEKQEYEEAVREVDHGLTILEEDEELTDKKEEIQQEYEEYQQSAATATVQMEIFYENYEEYGVITAVDGAGEELWSVTTGRYAQAQLERLASVGLYGEVYYYVEDGDVVALRASDGSELWRNSEFGGAAVSFDLDEEGNLYLCGYFGPDFFGIDAEGNTLVKIDSFSSDYYWAYGLQVEGAYATVSMEGTPSGPGYAEFRVNLGDYSYEMSGEEQESQGQTGSAEWTLEEICRRVGEYYTAEIGNGSSYVVFESECRETDTGYWMILRYQGGSSANQLATDVTVNTETGQVTDGWGGQWSLYD